jgi:hypothetical protein
MFTADDYFNITNARILNENVNSIDEEVSYIFENYTEEEILELIERKDIPQEVALKVADMLKGAPKFSRRGQVAQNLRLYAVGRNKKRVQKLNQPTESFDAVVEYLFVEGYTDTIEGAELMAESISETWVNQILESEDSNWNAVRKSTSRRKPSTSPIRVGRKSVLKPSDVTPPDPEVTERRKKRGNKLNFEVK